MRRFLDQEKFLLALLVFALSLFAFQFVSLKTAFHFVEWQTIAALCGLLVLSRGLEESAYLHLFAERILDRLASERRAATFLILVSVLLAAVITNDVALFVVVPLTLGMASRMKNFRLGRLVIFEALAVNIGSAFTPIGNPQNLFLWQTSGVSFYRFFCVMWPLELPLLVILILAAQVAFSKRKIEKHSVDRIMPLDPKLFWISLGLYPFFLTALELDWALSAAGMVLVVYVFFARRVLKNLDWAILLIFILMFIDFRALASAGWVRAVSHSLMIRPHGSYAAATLFSQLISNVPATILLHQLRSPWQELALGANVGGFGLMVGSLANLIALRLSKVRGLWREFHLWSLTMFAVAYFLGLLVLQAKP